MNHKRRVFVIWQNKAAARKNRRQFRAATLIASARKGTLVRMWAEEQLRLMSMQMNQRVFFGVTHSVHLLVKKLTMVDPATCRPWSTRT